MLKNPNGKSKASSLADLFASNDAVINDWCNSFLSPNEQRQVLLCYW